MSLPTVTEMCRTALDTLRSQRAGLAAEIADRSARLAALDAEISAREAALQEVQDLGYVGVAADVALAVAHAGGDAAAMDAAAATAPVIATPALGP